MQASSPSRPAWPICPLSRWNRDALRDSHLLLPSLRGFIEGADKGVRGGKTD